MFTKNLQSHFIGILIIAFFVLSACAPTGQNEPEGILPAEPTNASEQSLAGIQQTTSTIEPTEIILATPISDAPASGICAESEDAIVTIVIMLDIPSPRCLKVLPNQQLSVKNDTDITYTMSLGSLEAEVGPGEEYTFELEFGKILLPGVHRLELSDPPGGAEIWLVEEF